MKNRPWAAALIVLFGFVCIVLILANGPNRLIKLNHDTRTVALLPSQKFTYRLRENTKVHVSSSDPVNVEGRFCSGLQVLDYECETIGDLTITDARNVILAVVSDRSVKMNAVKIDVRY
jgi:hypothetical protein